MTCSASFQTVSARCWSGRIRYSMITKRLARSSTVVANSFPIPVPDMVGKPGQSDIRLSRVGDWGVLVGTTLLKLYLNDVDDQGPRPRRRGTHHQGRNSSRVTEYKGNSQLNR
jgi:hypothetical protein